MAKNAPIRLKIGHMMHLYGFEQFPKCCQNRPIFGQKPAFLRFSDMPVEKYFFGGKLMRFQENGPIYLKMDIHVPYDPYYRAKDRFFDILCFWHFTVL